MGCFGSKQKKNRHQYGPSGEVYYGDTLGGYSDSNYVGESAGGGGGGDSGGGGGWFGGGDCDGGGGGGDGGGGGGCD